MSAGEESTPERAGDKESFDKNTPEMDISRTEQESDNRKTPDKISDAKNMSQKSYTRKPNKGSRGSTAEEEQHSAAEEELSSERCQGRTQENQFLRTSQKIFNLKNVKDGSTKETPESDDKSSEEQRVCSEEKALKPSGESPDPPIPQTEQKPEKLQEFDTVQVEQGPGPAGGAAELDKPTKPVRTEFVRPVVGYFCNLCQLIYADEDEAKLQHCSSLMHYKKYQKRMGERPVDNVKEQF